MEEPIIIFLLVFTLLLAACDRPTSSEEISYSTSAPEGAEETLRFAIHPLHNPQKLFEAYQPLIDYLNDHLQNVHIELEASRDYPAYEKKFRARSPELLLPNPWQTLQAKKLGYNVIGMAGDAEDFRGIFIVRRDSQITIPGELKGKTVSYPASTALAAAIMPQYYLHENGINVNQDIENIYVGSQESSIMNVFLGKAVAGATWPPPWRLFQKDHPEMAKHLKVIWQTAPLINNSVMVRDDVPVILSKQIQTLLVDLFKTVEGKAILAGMETARIYKADNTSYDMVQTYINNFEALVRPVEIP